MEPIKPRRVGFGLEHGPIENFNSGMGQRCDQNKQLKSLRCLSNIPIKNLALILLDFGLVRC